MIVFNLDAKPQNDDLRFCVDYSAIIIRSAISIPLLRKNITSGEIEDGLCKINEVKNNKLVVCVNEFWFSNGEKLQPEHIKSSIEFLLKHDNYVKALLEDLNRIVIKGDRVIFLHNKNVKFINLMTNVRFSPFNNNRDFCGKFQIKERCEDCIILESNKYNSKFYNQIKFNFVKNNLEDLDLFKNNKADFTNPTTFPIKLLNKCKQDLKCYKNYIFFNLTFTNRKLLRSEFDDLRKTIYQGISRDVFAKKMFPLLRAVCNFKLNKDTGHTASPLQYNEPIYLTIGYDDFYPNKEICENLKKELSIYNIFLIPKETDFYNRETKYDLQLNLIIPDIIDDSNFYCSKYFELILKISDNVKYENFIKLKKKYLITGEDCYFYGMSKIIDEKYLEIPLYVGNAVYLSKNDHFNFVDLNFEIFDIDKQ